MDILNIKHNLKIIIILKINIFKKHTTCCILFSDFINYMFLALFMAFKIKVFLFFYLDALAAPGVGPLCTTRLLVAPPLVPVASGILLQRGPASTAAGQLAAPLPPPACHLTPVWEQS